MVRLPFGPIQQRRHATLAITPNRLRADQPAGAAKKYDICKPNKAGFLLSSSVMVTTGIVSLAIVFVILKFLCPGYEGLAAVMPGIVFLFFHFCLHDFVERMISWRPGKSLRKRGR
ncbi:MAG: hypothetical protein Q4Q62_01310 [Thermoplasmata archaeon]|nr:hypothetical protein [Thermoplasmata archaeon]